MKAIQIGLAMAMSLCLSLPAMGQSVFHPEEWQSYVGNFVAEDGRVVDTGNGGISHSESQGYGMVLAVLANDRETFERVWDFTATKMMVRDDGLAAWLWDPNSEQGIADSNNATDGDMLIAYGLLLAAEAWDEPTYHVVARGIVRTIRANLLLESDGLKGIVPGAIGFTDREDGPVFNPSYWIFEVFPAFAEADPEGGWDDLTQSGLDLLRRAAMIKAGIPSDWVQFGKGAIAPAKGFDAEFGYNGIRIPLYLMRAGLDPAYLRPFLRNAPEPNLSKVNVVNGALVEPISEPGYQLIRAAMDCTLNDKNVPNELQTMTASSYYASTLQLLMLDHLRRNAPECLDGEAADG